MTVELPVKSPSVGAPLSVALTLTLLSPDSMAKLLPWEYPLKVSVALVPLFSVTWLPEVKRMVAAAVQEILMLVA